MMQLRQRETRQKVTIRARLRSESGWSDVVIGNVSSRGLMLRCGEPPQQRAFIEVRHQNVVIVGRIVWTSGLQCGVRTQDEVDIPSLVSSRPSKARKPGKDRRAAPRAAPRRPTPNERAEASQRLGRMFQFVVLAFAAIASSVIVGSMVIEVMASPLEAVRDAMSG
jgi:hypothetical protein